MKKLLRAEIYSAFLKMGQKGLPVDGATYLVVRERLGDPNLCGQWAQTGFPPPPPLPPPQTPSKKRSKRSPSAGSKGMAPKPTKRPRRFEVESIVEESGPWGGHRRWFMVKWAGYHASWEAWRIRGEPGTPLETWEPLRTVARTQALADWDRARAE